MRVFLRALSVSVLVCLATLSTFGQGSQRKDRVQAVDGRAMGGQTVITCAYNSASYTLGLYTGTVPCSPSITTYADVALSVPNNIPLLTDSQGNFTYWLAAGNYTECVTGPNVTPACYAITLGGSGGGTNILPLNNVFSGTLNQFQGLSAASVTTSSLTDQGTSAGGYVCSIAGLFSVAGCPAFPSATPAGPTFAIQNANSGASAFATFTGLNSQLFGLSIFGGGSNPNFVTLPWSTAMCGPSPWYDAECWGAHARTGFQHTTAIASAGTSVTLASAIDFQNGEGIDILAAGAAPSGISAPAAPTVTSPAVSGSTTYHAQCVAIDAHNGLVGGAVATFATGPASFAATPISNSALTRSTSGLLTITVANSYVANGSTEPTLITISGAVPSDLNGTYVISSANSTTVTAQSAMNEAATETATSAGTSQVWPYIDVTCPNTVSTSVVQYAVYTDTQGSMKYIGNTMPGLLGTASASVIRDWGPTVMAGSSAQPPFGIPATPPAASATVNEEYTGTIVSGGGTTSIVVTPALSNAVSSTAVVHEDGLALIAAMNAAAANGGGAAYLPPNQFYGQTNAFYSFNAPLTLPNKVDIYAAGGMSINNTLTFGSFSHIYAAPSPSTTTSSQFSLQQYVAWGTTGSPGLYFPGLGSGFSGIQVETFNNGNVGALFNNNQVTIANSNLVTNTSETASIPLAFQGPLTGIRITNVNSTNTGFAIPAPMIPWLWFKSNGVCSAICGIPNDIVMDGINTMNNRGILIDSSIGRGSNSEQNYRFYVQEDQAPATPGLMFYGDLYASNVHLNDIIMDSQPQAALGNWATNLQSTFLENADTVAGTCAVTGNAVVGLVTSTPTCAGQNVTARNLLDQSFRVSTATLVQGGTVNYDFGQPDIYSSTVETPLAWAYPTPQITAVSTSGSIAPGTYNVAMAIRGYNGGDSALSNVVVVTLGSTGGITVTCSNCGSLPANKGFDFYLNQKGQTGNPFVSSTQTFTTATINENEAFLDGTGLPLFDATGIYGFNILDTDLISSGLSSVCATAGGVLTISGCTVGTGTVTNPSGNFTLGYPATSANATTGIAASPIFIDASQFSGADGSVKIAAATAGCVTPNAGCYIDATATATPGATVTWTTNPLSNITTTGSAGIYIKLPCAQILTNVQWYSPSSDVVVTGCGLHSGAAALQMSASFPASTPLVLMGDGTNKVSHSQYVNVRFVVGSGPATGTIFMGKLLQEQAGLVNDVLVGKNSATATSAMATCLGCSHEVFSGDEFYQSGANDSLLLDGNNAILLALGDISNDTFNNTGVNQGTNGIHVQDTGASGTTYYNANIGKSIHGENIANVVNFDSQSSGDADGVDCTANCTNVVVRNTTGTVTLNNIGAGVGVQYLDNTAGTSIGIANFQRIFSGGAGSGAMLMSGTIWPTIAKSAGYTLGYGDEQVTFTGTINITVPVAPPTTGTAKRWLVINDGVGTGTLACSSGNINGSATLALTANQSVTVTADGVNCFSTSGSGSVGTSTQYANTYWATTSALGGVAAPSTNGTYVCGYSITGSAAVAPTCPQLGFGGRSIITTTASDPVTYADVASVINHDVGASNANTETLPTATTLLNPAFSFVYTNHSAFLDTITATTWTIQLNGAAATASISVPSGASVRIKVDPNSATLWDADCALCQVNAFTTLTDAATVSWNIGKQPNANASLTFTVHSGSRTLNVSNMVVGGNYLSKIIQDATGGEGLTLGTGCTWKIINGGGGAVTPSTGANAIDVLAWIFDGTNCIGSLGKNYN